MQHFECVLKTRDGLHLYAQGWQPETEPKAVVCLVHGLGEHSGRYAHLVTYLSKARYASLAFDLRGHGKSEGRRGHPSSYEIVLDDISHLLEEAEKRHLDRPRFLYGNSLGGNLVINYALRRRPQVAGVIATAPALRPAFKPPSWKMTLGRIMRYIWPTMSMRHGVDFQAVSRDPEVVEALQNDPLVHDRLTARFAMEFLEAGSWALEHAAEFPVPLLLMQGSANRIVSAQASHDFAVKAGDCCTLKIWDGLYHELHNEPEKEQVFVYLLEWLEGKL